MTLTVRRVVLMVAVGLLGSACTLASPTYITTAREAEPKAETDTSPVTAGPSGDGSRAPSCGSDDFAKPDLGTLTPCGDGKGHCYDKTKVSGADLFTACPNAAEVCVPDEILEAGGQPLKACTSIIGDGACVTAELIPRIKAEGGDALQRDVCDADQKCVPCVDPRKNNAPSGFCEPAGVHENACTGGAAGEGETPAEPAVELQGCCSSGGEDRGVCLAESGIPPERLDSTITDTCKEGTRCVPAALVENRPVKCTAGALMGRGICLDKCFNRMMSLAGTVGALRQDTCGDTEVCVPCFALEKMGAPGCE